MTSDTLNLIIGAVLGAIFGLLLPIIIQKIKVNKIEKYKIKRNKYLANDKLMKWLLLNHMDNEKRYDIVNNLSFVEIGSCRDQVPFYSKKEWSPQNCKTDLIEISMKMDSILKYHKSAKNNFVINESLIIYRKKIGHNIWNAPCIYLDSISMENSQVLLHVKTCDYYAIATNLIQLEEETIRGAKQGSFKKCDIRRKYYLELNKLDQKMYKPMPLGCMVVFALKAPKGYEIIMQTRSDQNLTANKDTSVVPDFGLSPFIGGIDTSPEINSLLYYNFIKEYLEELHCMEELIKEFERSKPDPQYYKWLYNQAPAKMLLENRNFHLYFLGFGFSLMNGIPNIGLLAKLDDDVAAQTLKNLLVTNWEIATPSRDNEFRPTIWYINSKTEIHRFEELFKNNQLPPNVSFFLSKALHYLE